MFEAVKEIERYRTDFPGVYPPDWPEMDQLLAAMEATRKKLDEPPVMKAESV